MHSVSMGSVCLALVAALAGCAGDDAAAKRLGELEREVQKLRATNVALDDRVEALEERGAGTATADDGEAAPAAADDRPALAVVRLAPEPEIGAPEAPQPGAATVAAPEDNDGMRPVIRGDARGVERVDEPVDGSKPGAKPAAGAKTPKTPPAPKAAAPLGAGGH
jgi:hypothetical protein